jgi:ankyrin repeat protein
MTKHIKKALYLFVLAAFFSAHAGSYEDFFRAVKGDDASTVRSLLQRGFDPNTPDPQTQTGLILALMEPSPKVAKVLLEAKQTNVEARNGKDESPLMMAALKGNQEAVSQLIARDADINKPGWTPLHYAATSGQVAIIKVLLEKSAFIDAQSPNGTTPLMMAAMYGTTETVKLLLDEGADIAMKNEQGMTAAAFAQRGQRPDAIGLLAAAARKQPAQAPRTDGKW